MIYQLPDDQLREAEWIADAITDARGDATPKWGQDLDQSSLDRRSGVIAEFSLRSVFDMQPWDRDTYPPFSDRDRADVGENCEVRATTHERGRLPLHKGHDDVMPRLVRDYALVVFVEDSRFRLPGWLPMRVALDFWYEVEFRPGRPCMAVDQDHLWPIEDLVVVEKGKTYRIQGQEGSSQPCMGCGGPAAPIDGYCGSCWFEYVYRPKHFGHIPGA